ncbi:hypothetical protein ACFX1Z_018601 [Malus domestica]
MNHVCTGDENVFWLNSKFLAERYANELMIDPDWSIELFRPTIQKDYRQEVTTQQIYRARQRAEKLNRGTWVEQYNKLEQYAAILKQTNPGHVGKKAILPRHVESNKIKHLLVNPLKE